MDKLNNYIEYVEEQIKKFQKHSKLIHNNEVSPYLLNRALGEYQDVNLMLIEQYQKNKSELFEIELNYQEWWDFKFMEIRTDMIKEMASKTVKLAVKEIETNLRVIYREEYKIWKETIKEAEMKTSFLRRLVEQWKKFDGILNTLSYNMQSELKALSIEDRASSKIQERQKRQIKKDYPVRR